MKNNRFLNLLFLTIFIFAGALATKSEGQTTTAVKAEKIDKEQLAGMIKPTLEKYLSNHPDQQVRIWSMVVLANLDKIDEQKTSSIPTLVLQLSNNDENIRQIALNSIRAALTLEGKEWKGIMGTVFRTTAKTTQYPEVKKLAIKSLGILQNLDEDSLDSLMLLFELAEDDDSDIRKAANEAIAVVLSSAETSSSDGGGAVLR
ncbi:MAG: HEAT repeat domain-containing protein [Candidatus Omnitrophota bacterium]